MRERTGVILPPTSWADTDSNPAVSARGILCQSQWPGRYTCPAPDVCRQPALWLREIQSHSLWGYPATVAPGIWTRLNFMQLRKTGPLRASTVSGQGAPQLYSQAVLVCLCQHPSSKPKAHAVGLYRGLPGEANRIGKELCSLSFLWFLVLERLHYR